MFALLRITIKYKNIYDWISKSILNSKIYTLKKNNLVKNDTFVVCRKCYIITKKCRIQLTYYMLNEVSKVTM